MGLAIKLTTIDEANTPTTTQNGSTSPNSTWIKSVAKPMTAAGKTAFSGTVKSMKGIGKIDTVSVKKTDDSVGTTT